MKAVERWSFNALHVVVACTGLLYLHMKYFMTTDDPFALVNHPWQGATLAAHILAAPAFVVAFGMILRSHTLPKIRHRRRTNRLTGWISLVTFGLMTLSGYLIQTSTTATLITIWSWTHIVSGCLFVAGYSTHVLIGWPISRRLRRRARRLRRRVRAARAG